MAIPYGPWFRINAIALDFAGQPRILDFFDVLHRSDCPPNGELPAPFDETNEAQI
jgi:hypothetical protein